MEIFLVSLMMMEHLVKNQELHPLCQEATASLLQKES